MKKYNKLFNKKTMLIGVGLLFGISIIPITAVVLTSCSNTGTSNSTTTQITTTDFSKTSSATSFLSDTFPSECSKWYESTENQTTFKKFILDSIIQGKKNDITIDDVEVAIPTNPPLANDNDGTIKITYTVRKYWENNQIINTAQKIELSLTGLKASKTTIALATYNIKDIFKDNISTASQFHAQLKNSAQWQQEIRTTINEKILSVPTTEPNAIQLHLDNVGVDDYARTMVLPFSVNGYYNQGQLIQTPKRFETTFNEFSYVSTDFKNNSTYIVNEYINAIRVSDLIQWDMEGFEYVSEAIKSLILEVCTSGNKDGLKETDISIKDVTATNVSNQAIISYTFTKYWNHSGLVTAESIVITVTCNDVGIDVG